MVPRLLCVLFIALLSLGASDNYPQVGKVETVLFGTSSPNLKLDKRLTKIEKSVFGESFDSEDFDKRTERIRSSVLGRYAIYGEVEAPKVNKQINLTSQGFENLETKEIPTEEFIELVYKFVNDERSYKGLLPLLRDDVAALTADEHASDLVSNSYLSYCNQKNQCPDERYTLLGGTGAISEIINGFEKQSNEKEVKLNELLAKQLVQAISSSPDDSQILFSPYVNYIGSSVAVSQDKTRLVSVIEILAKGAALDPVKPVINFGEKIMITGKISKPYTLKAIAVGYEEPRKRNLFPDEQSFDTGNLRPYFPPQDYVAYGNTSKGKLLKVLKGLGIIGAIGAAPFTGGATVVLAPVLLSSIQNAPPREIPLKGGIKVNKQGEFSGEIELNYQGRSGLYFISILGELPGLNFPIVISRRTVRVRNVLLPTG